MSALSDRVKSAVQKAMDNGKVSCEVMSDEFECGLPVKIKMKTMLDEQGVVCWFESLADEKVKIWLRWGKLLHDGLSALSLLGDSISGKKPEGGGSIRG